MIDLLPCKEIRQNTTLYGHAKKMPVKRKTIVDKETDVLGLKPFFWKKDKYDWVPKPGPFDDKLHLFNHTNLTPGEPGMTPVEWLARPKDPGYTDEWGDTWYDASDAVQGIPIAAGLWTMWHPTIPWMHFDNIVSVFAMLLIGRDLPELVYVPFEDIHEALRAMDLDKWPNFKNPATLSPQALEIWDKVQQVIRYYETCDMKPCMDFAAAFKGHTMEHQREAMMHVLKTAQWQRHITPNTGWHPHYINMLLRDQSLPYL